MVGDRASSCGALQLRFDAAVRGDARGLDGQQARAAVEQTGPVREVPVGGGAVDVDQCELLAGGVVLCKDWAWAALTLLAAWLLQCTCPCGTPDLCDPRLIFTAHDAEEAVVLGAYLDDVLVGVPAALAAQADATNRSSAAMAAALTSLKNTKDPNDQ